MEEHSEISNRNSFLLRNFQQVEQSFNVWMHSTADCRGKERKWVSKVLSLFSTTLSLSTHTLFFILNDALNVKKLNNYALFTLFYVS